MNCAVFYLGKTSIYYVKMVWSLKKEFQQGNRIYLKTLSIDIFERWISGNVKQSFIVLDVFSSSANICKDLILELRKKNTTTGC